MYEYKATIKRIIDGDTVVVDIDLGFNMTLCDEHIRLYYIDAPESRSSDLVEKHFGELATQHVEKYIPAGTTHTFICKRFEQARYGRVAGDFSVYDPESDSWMLLTEIMVRDHHAVKYSDNSPVTLAEQHQQNWDTLVEQGVTEILFPDDD